MKQFSTVGELVALLGTLPKDTPFYICGAIGYYYEFENGKVICLDYEDLVQEE